MTTTQAFTAAKPLAAKAEEYRTLAGSHGLSVEISTDYETASVSEVVIHSHNPEVYVLVHVVPAAFGMVRSIAWIHNRADEYPIPNDQIASYIAGLPKPAPKSFARGGSLWSAS